jgi:predicted ATPase
LPTVAELAPLADPSLVPATVAAAVGLDLGGGEVSAQRVAQALADRHLLLVLDTCEHVIAAAAAMAEALLRAGSALRILATSREPLRAEGERVYPVPPLAVPTTEGEDPWPYGDRGNLVEIWSSENLRSALCHTPKRAVHAGAVLQTRP